MKTIQRITGIQFNINSKVYAYKNSNTSSEFATLTYYINNTIDIGNKGNYLYILNTRNIELEIYTYSYSRISFANPMNVTNISLLLTPYNGYLWNNLIIPGSSFQIRISKEEAFHTMDTVFAMRLKRYDQNFDITFILTNKEK